MRTLVALLALSATALAQDNNRFTEFLVNRMKDRLKLTDDQVTKVKEILSKDAEERTKLDDARTAKINELLDDEQKKGYEEMRRQFRGFGGGQGGQGGQGGGGGFRFGGGQGGQFGQQGLVQMDDLKRELTLTDEQVEKIKPVVDEFNAPLQKRMEEFRNGTFNWQNFDWTGELSKYADGLKALNEKIKAHLTDEQKSKADALYERNTSWMRFIPGLMNRGGGEGSRRQSPEERLRRAMEALRIENEDERSAIKDLVEKIVKAQAEYEDWQKSAREKLNETGKNKELSDAALEDRIKENQEERRKREKDIATLQKKLAEAVNNRQEIELMVQGILK